MITTINENDFIQAFKNMGRDNQFTHEALQELFAYYEEYEDSTGEKVELDVIAICCDWTEYESEYELINDYDMSIKGGLDEIKENTTVLKVKNHYLVMNF